MFHSNVEIAFALLVAGAILCALLRSWRVAGWLAAVFVAIATVLAWSEAVRVIARGASLHSTIAMLPLIGSSIAVNLDTLGAGFLALVTTVLFFATIYSVGYMDRQDELGRPASFYTPFLLFAATMIGVVSVRDWLLFFVFWELMTLASYVLVVFNREDPNAQRAGLKYFVITHVASACLLTATIVLWQKTGSFSFDLQSNALAHSSLWLRSVLLTLFLVAFATKAGAFPFGDWVPDAYHAAWSNVTAVFSGVMSKLGVYGLIRIFWETLPKSGNSWETIAWGLVLGTIGVLSAFVGGMTAMRESDCKRLLAFSSIGQTGYILIPLGVGICFSQWQGLEAIALLAMLGTGFHILNDALYKSLLFMSSGSVSYYCGTRDLNKIGGLATVMPWVAAAAFIGALSLSGLPPTNGFASKWVIYQSSISAGLRFAPFLIVAVIAFFAGLTTFAYSLKFFYGTAFLGSPNLEYEPKRLPRTMTVAQVALAVVCIVIGLVPATAVKVVEAVLQIQKETLYRIGSFGELATVPGVHPLSAYWNPVGLGLALFICVLFAEFVKRLAKPQKRTVPNWYCGEEHLEHEVRFRAQDFYAPFNEVFARVYPRLPVPRLTALRNIRRVLDLDSWLFRPIVNFSAGFVSKVSKTHAGTPQLYMIWQIAGMIVVFAILFVIMK
ncbi:MAG: complex I subunit 5 family protein [Armatimonadota bacterium]